jgi:hypothetical protein
MRAKVQRIRTIHRINRKAMREKGGKEINRGTEE